MFLVILLRIYFIFAKDAIWEHMQFLFSNIVHFSIYQIQTKHITCFSPDKKGAFGASQFSPQSLAKNSPETPPAQYSFLPNTSV